MSLSDEERVRDNRRKGEKLEKTARSDADKHPVVAISEAVIVLAVTVLKPYSLNHRHLSQVV